MWRNKPHRSLSAINLESVTSIIMWPSLHRKRFSTYPLWSSADRTSLLPAGCRVQLKNSSWTQDGPKLCEILLPKVDKYGRLFTKWDSFPDSAADIRHDVRCYCTIGGQTICGDQVGTKSIYSPCSLNVYPTFNPAPQNIFKRPVGKVLELCGDNVESMLSAASKQ